ncbi:hypothetical protein BDV06DRAFT_196672 [Aspergillus oleicola]
MTYEWIPPTQLRYYSLQLVCEFMPIGTYPRDRIACYYSLGAVANAASAVIFSVVILRDNAPDRGHAKAGGILNIYIWN